MREMRKARLARRDLAHLALVALFIALLATACGGTTTTDREADTATAEREEIDPSGSSGVMSRPTA
jgi:ABC-type phosphate transport system substrate-binding protein